MKNNTRFNIERSILPHKLYTSGPMLILDLMDSPGRYMVDLFTSNPDSGCTYTESDFKEAHKVFSSGVASVMIMQISMPKTNYIDECRSVYFCYGIPGGNDLYCCSAYDGNGTYVLYGFTEDGEWVNLGSIAEADDEFGVIAKNYWELINNYARGRYKNICPG